MPVLYEGDMLSRHKDLSDLDYAMNYKIPQIDSSCHTIPFPTFFAYFYSWKKIIQYGPKSTNKDVTLI